MLLKSCVFVCVCVDQETALYENPIVLLYLGVGQSFEAGHMFAIYFES